jgi:hypothetical protein
MSEKVLPRSSVTAPFQRIKVPINWNKLRKEVPEGFAMAGRF